MTATAYVAVEISIHALLAESDHNLTQGVFNLFTFLSTLSLRRATTRGSKKMELNNFYPRSPCGERPHPIAVFICIIEISIHALLAESDQLQGFLLAQGHNFYPRSPCGERPPRGRSALLNTQFLSTLSLRRATERTNARIVEKYKFLSTLSLRRATGDPRLYGRRGSISIHALLAESDPCGWK